MAEVKVQIEFDISALRTDMSAEVPMLDSLGFLGEAPFCLQGSVTSKMTNRLSDKLVDGEEFRHIWSNPTRQMRKHSSERHMRKHSSERRRVRSKSINRRKTEKTSGDEPIMQHSPSVPARLVSFLPNIEDVTVPRFCNYGNHTFNEYKTPRQVQCEGCHRMAQPGEIVFGCSRCQFDECMDCAATRKGHQKEPQSPKPSTAATSLPPSRSSSPMNRTDSSMSSGEMSRTASKVCKNCKKGMKGFGDICADCRQAGPEGPIRHCNLCGEFWRGWKEECAACG